MDERVMSRGPPLEFLRPVAEKAEGNSFQLVQQMDPERLKGSFRHARGKFLGIGRLLAARKQPCNMFDVGIQRMRQVQGFLTNSESPPFDR